VLDLQAPKKKLDRHKTQEKKSTQTPTHVRRSRELLTGGVAVKRKNTKLLAGPGRSHETK
jgi:hypothetical protein